MIVKSTGYFCKKCPVLFIRKEPRMKLKTKLVIVFLVVMILPMIFITVGVHMIGRGESGEVMQLYIMLDDITTALLFY